MKLEIIEDHPAMLHFVGNCFIVQDGEKLVGVFNSRSDAELFVRAKEAADSGLILTPPVPPVRPIPIGDGQNGACTAVAAVDALKVESSIGGWYSTITYRPADDVAPDIVIEDHGGES